MEIGRVKANPEDLKKKNSKKFGEELLTLATSLFMEDVQDAIEEQAKAVAKIKEIVKKRADLKLGRVRAFLKSENPQFIKACKQVQLEPTYRQASKWLNKKGLAWKEGRS